MIPGGALVLVKVYAMENPTWETSKENIKPVKSGRAVGDIDKAKKRGLSSADDRAEEKYCKLIGYLVMKCRKFTDEIARATADDDVLDAWLRYIKWARNTFPSSSSKTLTVLEAATRALQDEDKYANDPRYVKCWIEYADLLPTPGEVFSYMLNRRIGGKVALFWIAWAFVTEKLGDHTMTDRVYQKGIRSGAEPKELLQSRYRQFQRRLARHYLNQQQEGEEAAADTRLQPDVRPTLATLSDSQRSVTRRPNPLCSAASSTNSTFSIFAENTTSAASTADRILASGEGTRTWKSFASSAATVKENTGALSPLFFKLYVFRCSEQIR